MQAWAPSVPGTEAVWGPGCCLLHRPAGRMSTALARAAELGSPRIPMELVKVCRGPAFRAGSWVNTGISVLQLLRGAYFPEGRPRGAWGPAGEPSLDRHLEPWFWRNFSTGWGPAVASWQLLPQSRGGGGQWTPSSPEALRVVYGGPTPKPGWGGILPAHTARWMAASVLEPGEGRRKSWHGSGSRVNRRLLPGAWAPKSKRGLAGVNCPRLTRVGPGDDTFMVLGDGEAVSSVKMDRHQVRDWAAWWLFALIFSPTVSSAP